MKTLKTTILIIVAFIFGALTTHIYAQSIKLIMVPDQIGNYNTIDLLDYVAKLKANQDAYDKAQITIPQVTQPSVVQPIPKPYQEIYRPQPVNPSSKGGNASA
jgi:hypothetical protein